MKTKTSSKKKKKAAADAGPSARQGPRQRGPFCVYGVPLPRRRASWEPRAWPRDAMFHAKRREKALALSSIMLYNAA